MTEPATVDELIGQRVHQVMFLRKMSARQMAPTMGISGSVLARKLRGAVAWSAADVMTAARHLDVSAAFLMGETDDPRPAGPDGDRLYAPRDSNPEPSGLELAPVIELSSRRAS